MNGARFADFIIINRIMRMNGTIKRKTDKNFGFITPDDNSADVFFHASSLVGVTFDELNLGDKVSFDTEQSDKGPRAANVQRA